MGSTPVRASEDALRDESARVLPGIQINVRNSNATVLARIISSSVQAFGRPPPTHRFCQSCDQKSSGSRASVAHQYLVGETPSISPLNTRSYPQATADTFGEVVSEAPRGGASTIEGAKIMGKHEDHPTSDLRIHAVRVGDAVSSGDTGRTEMSLVVPNRGSNRDALPTRSPVLQKKNDA